MKTIMVLLMMTVAFGIGAAASMTMPQDETALLGDTAAQPTLTQEMIDEFSDSVETLLGVTLSQEQGDELHGLLMRAWRLHDANGMSMVMDSVDGWDALRDLPPARRAAVAKQLRPQAIAQLRRGGGDIEKWMLDVYERASSESSASAATAAIDTKQICP
jgi:hypothetical protein